MMASRIRSLVALALAVAAVAATAPVFAADRPADQEEVVQAQKTFTRFVHDPDFTWFRKHRHEALGFLIVPKVVKAAFILGGSGGRAVLVAKNDKGWSAPAFYTIATGSAGLQIGISNSEGVMLIMKKKGLDSLMAQSMKFGADASIAIGPVGSGVAGDADFVVFMRAKGAYAGGNVNGSVVTPSAEFNKAHYGKDVTPIDIVVRGDVQKSKEDEALIAAVSK
jgi:lipid-binding SYLF domain-containing protein